MQAYKNFGARINNMKKKLDELRKTFPVVESPIPSPDVNAPSPDNTPLIEEPEFNFDPSPPSQDFTQNCKLRATLLSPFWLIQDLFYTLMIVSVAVLDAIISHFWVWLMLFVMIISNRQF